MGLAQKSSSTENVSPGWYIKSPLRQYVTWGWHKKDFFTKILKGACINKLLKLDMLGGAGSKMLNSRKMLDMNGIEKASLNSVC